MSAVETPNNSSDFDLEKILREWDVRKEQEKADFLDILYDFYKPTNHCYTGLYQQFGRDLLESFRELIVSGKFVLKTVDDSNGTDKVGSICEPLCDV